MKSKKNLVALFVCVILIMTLIPLNALAASVWTEIGGGPVSDGTAGNVRIAITGGDVYCAYLDGSPTWKPTVKKADGGIWTGGLVADCMSYSIDIETNPSNGRIYAAYTDQTANKLYVKEYIDGMGWQQVGGEVYSSGGMMVDLEFIGTVPYVAYRSGSDYDAYVFKLDGVNWVQVGTAAHVGTARALALTGYNGNPVVCYADDSYNLYVTGWNSGIGWQPVCSSSAGTTSSSYGYIDIMMYGVIPYIAYGDSSGAAYVKKTEDGMSWTTVGTGLPVSGAGNYRLAQQGSTLYLGVSDQTEAQLYTYDNSTETGWTRVSGHHLGRAMPEQRIGYEAV